MYQPRFLQLQIEGTDHIMEVKVGTPITVCELTQAEKMLCGWGHYVIVKCNGIRLPLDALLQSNVLYSVEIRRSCQVQACPIPSLTFAGGHGNIATCLGDSTIWKFMRQLGLAHQKQEGTGPFMLYPFRALQFLSHALPPAVGLTWQHGLRQSSGKLYVICELYGHWILLCGSEDQILDGIEWVLYDGLSQQELMAPALHIVSKISLMLNKGCIGLSMGLGLQQTQASTCGTIALVQMALDLRLACAPGPEELLALHVWLLTLQTRGHIFASGPDDASSKLAQLLASKGVPDEKALERAQQIVGKFGQKQIQAVLKAKNPWADLKAMASKPGMLFRLLTAEEQSNYIAQRAQTKHGAQIKNHKMKKANKGSPKQGPVPLDPLQFELDCAHFQDDFEVPVEQILFSAVEADKRGIALCNTAMAQKFLDSPKSISMEALALLIIDKPSEEHIQKAKLTKIVIPAKCTSTQEHILIFGFIMQLGDVQVSRTFTGESAPLKNSLTHK